MTEPTPEAGERPRVLVVCYGNLCRSPMAEALLRARLGPKWELISAGTHAFGGDPPTRTACEAIRREEGLDIRGQRSCRLTREAIVSSAHIFTMSIQQARLAAELAPEARTRIRLFGAFAPDAGNPADAGMGDPGGSRTGPLEVPDPMGGDLQEYVSCLRRLGRCADACARWLLDGAQPESAPTPV